MRVALYAEFTAIAGADERVGLLVNAFASEVRAEPGSITFDPHRLAGERGRFFVYEVYANKEAFAAHLASAHGNAFNRELAELVEGGRSYLTMLEPISHD
jgi:quinol monooxygenase YgiN